MNEERIRELTEKFRAAGADNPESWARSEVEEGIPQLAYFSFCRSLWHVVKDEDDDAWIEREIETARRWPDDPCAQIGPALAEMREKGVSSRAIVDLARVMQYEALYHACSILDHSRMEDVPTHAWSLYTEDDQGRPQRRMGGSHEILLSLDPTGREMRPRKG